MMELPGYVKIVEVGARDGLQNEKKIITTEQKIALINGLTQAGLKHIEATSFVSPKWVPQMADAVGVYQGIEKPTGHHYPVLVPNLKGMQKALDLNVKEIAIFAAASESFSQKNINCSIDESLARYADVIQLAKENNIAIRGYVSCVLGCPYQGEVPLEKVYDVAQRLYQMGCYEISLGDTIGVGTAKNAANMIQIIKQDIPVEKLAVHFHDTYGQALANILASLQQGISVIDSSVAGLGGCPYAKGATGNVATEDVIYMLHGMGIKTDVDLQALIQVGQKISLQLDRQNNSKVAVAY